MRGVVLCGDADLPDCMREVGGRAVIDYALATLILCGIGEIIIVADANAITRLQNHLGGGDGWGISVNYALAPAAPADFADSNNSALRKLTLAAEFVGDGAMAIVRGGYALCDVGDVPDLPRLVAIKKGARLLCAAGGDDAHHDARLAIYDKTAFMRIRKLIESSAAPNLDALDALDALDTAYQTDNALAIEMCESRDWTRLDALDKNAAPVTIEAAAKRAGFIE